MPLNLWTLTYISEVAKTGSISRAAQNLYLSQPHLSNTLKSVEEELGILLFRRTAQGMILTKDGEVFIKKANSILAEVNSLEEVFSTELNDTMRFRISAIRCRRVMDCIAKLINENINRNHVVIQLKETNPFEVLENVRDNVADLGIINIFDTQKEFFINAFKEYSLQYTFHYSKEYVLLMSNQNQLAHVPTITSDMLQTQTAVLYGDYESTAASYDSVTENSEIYISTKRIYVYDRATGEGILSKCHSSYSWVSGMDPAELKHKNLVLRRCDNVSVCNLGYSVLLPGKSPMPLIAELQNRLSNLSWDNEVVA